MDATFSSFWFQSNHCDEPCSNCGNLSFKIILNKSWSLLLILWLVTNSSSTSCLIFNAIAAVLCFFCCLEIPDFISKSFSQLKFVVELALAVKNLLLPASKLLALYLESFFCTMYVHLTDQMVSKLSFSSLTCPFDDSTHAALPPSLLGNVFLKLIRLSNKLSKSWLPFQVLNVLNSSASKPMFPLFKFCRTFLKHSWVEEISAPSLTHKPHVRSSLIDLLMSMAHVLWILK